MSAPAAVRLRLPSRIDPAVAGLVLLLLGALAVMVYLGRGSTFFYDEWVWWWSEPSLAPGVLLEPNNGHPCLVPNVIWNATILATCFGQVYLPFQLSWYFSLLGLIAGLWVLLAAKVGRGVALAVVAPFAVMGTGWLSLLMPIAGLFHVLPLAWLAWALVALERRTRRGDVIACVLLVLAAFTSVTGLASVVAGAYLLWQRPEMRRLWVVGIPLGPAAAWSPATARTRAPRAR